MLTILNIDDDLAGLLRKRAGQEGHSFKKVVNQLLRAGIAASGEDAPPRKRMQVMTRPLGLKADYDPDKLNQLVDELEAGDFLRKVPKDDFPGR